MKAAYHTLGCKVNQYDTEAMRELFEQAGYETVPFDGSADLYVINTCTVTGVGDKKSLQLIRRCGFRSLMILTPDGFREEDIDRF